MKHLKIFLYISVISVLLTTGFFIFNKSGNSLSILLEKIYTENDGGPEPDSHPLSIKALKDGEYPGSEISYEQTLSPGSNYKRYIVSYKSEGLKIYALLTIPLGNITDIGFPAIIFNHGYVPPSEYKTTERYVAYQDAFAGNGYVTIKPDFRGHGNSEGPARGGYGNNDYTVDVLNALESVKKLQNPDSDSLIVNPGKIGMWGHSMGGQITLESMVVRKDIKAGVIWAGVVGSYEDLLFNWRRNRPGVTSAPSGRGSWRQDLIEKYGPPEDNPEFWNSLSATAYLSDLSGPIQLHHGEADTSVPVEFSRNLNNRIINTGGYSEIYTYPGDDHNISSNINIALQRSVEFFDRFL